MLNKIIRGRLNQLTVEDRIVLTRFIAGLVYGLGVYIASIFIHPLPLSSYSWGLSVLAYYFTVLYILVKYTPKSRFQLYLRGLATYYGTWILTAIILHELTNIIRG